MRIHIYDNDRQYSDHAYYFVAEHPEFTADEFERLLRAWVAYRKEEALEGLRLVAIVLPVELSPGLAAYPTGISTIAEFIDHMRHAPAVGGLSEAAHAAVQTLGEELVLKLSTLLDAERGGQESELQGRVAAAVEGAQLPESSPAAEGVAATGEGTMSDEKTSRPNPTATAIAAWLREVADQHRKAAGTEIALAGSGEVKEPFDPATLRALAQSNLNGAQMLEGLAYQVEQRTWPMDGPEVYVHHLHHGRPACGRPDVPGDWPAGHKWSANWGEVTCSECLLRLEAGGRSPA